MKTIKAFYEKLYSTKEIVQDKNSIFLTDIPKLNKDNQEMCQEGKVTKNECFEVLKEMKFNKSPGNDGFTVEFYCTFWPMLGDILIDALNEAYDKGELATSQKQGVITLIEKEGKDTLNIKNYTPITLLNVDYKNIKSVSEKDKRSIERNNTS